MHLSIALAGASVLLASTLCSADSTVGFNEVMYHPPGDESALEWLELHNQMGVDVDISGWSFSSGVSFVFPEGTIVRGGGFVVVAADPDLLATAGVFQGALGPYTGRLDNSGESLELLSNSGRSMDSFSYKDSGAWPAGADGSGASLAKRQPALGSSRPESWTFSAELGGTPGRHNFAVTLGPGALPGELISYWSLDQAAGTMADLASGSNGTLGSGATRVAGIVGPRAVSFNNTSTAFIAVGPGIANSFSTTDGITVEALIEPTWSVAAGDHDSVFRKEDSDRRILLAFQNDGNSNGFSNPPVAPGPVLSFGLNVGGAYSELDMPLDGAAGRPSLLDVLDGTPHHVAGTYDAATGLKAIYFDGVLAFSVNLGAGSVVASGGGAAGYIGNTTGRAEPFSGLIDEVAIWRKGLAAAEIASHWANAQAGKNYFAASGGAGASSPALAFNETFAPLAGAGWVELQNIGTSPIDLDGLVFTAADAGRDQVLAAGSLAPGARIVLGEAAAGFDIVPGDTAFVYAAGKSELLAAVHLEEGLRARFPDGNGRWQAPVRATPGSANEVELHDEIVINEILYRPRLDRSFTPPRESPGSWIELYHRGGSAVDLTGWSLQEGVDFVFPAGTRMAPGEYLVVAQDAAFVRALHPGVRVLGDFQRRLSHKGDRIELLDASGNVADSVRYRDAGRWPDYADGGGSSLELRDPDADNSKPEAWAASDEAGKSHWQQYSYTVIAAAGVGPIQWNEFVLGLLDRGEALIDDISVLESPDTTPKQLIQNGGFDVDASKWRLLGNHGRSEVVPDPEDPTNPVLHLVASGPTEHMHNHLETTLAGGARVVNGRKYEISFVAKWLAGSNQVHSRLYFNRCPKTTLLEVPATEGTPGARNSRYDGNIGPTFDGFAHAPAVPQPGAPVTVSVQAEDPDGVASAKLWYSVNAAAWQSVPMTAGAAGSYSAQVPGQAASALVQFYVEATDGLGAVSTFPARGRDSRALFRVEDGQAILGRVHNLRILMTAADTSFLHLETNVMSNERLGCTLVSDENEVFYDAAIRLKGSERGRNVAARVGFNIKVDGDHLFRGVHESIQVDRSGGWKFGGPMGQDEIVVKHVAAHAGGIPCMYDDLIRVIAPRAAQNGPALLILAAYGDVFLDSYYPDGSEGHSFELELIYYPTTTVGGTPEGLKRPEPDEVLGTDFTNLGNDKEPYRQTFLIENHRDRDDYSGLIGVCKAFAQPTGSLLAGTDAVIDIDQWMRAFVLYSLCGINDAYTQGNNHNLIVHQRTTDAKFEALPWDMDFAWVLAVNSPLWGNQNLGRLTALPAARRLFYCHLSDCIESTFNTQYMGRWTAHYGSLAGQDYSSILTFINQRRTYVLGQLPPKIAFAITTNGGSDFAVGTTSAVVDGNAWIDVKDILVGGAAVPLEPAWPSATRWQATVPLDAGENHLTFFGIGLAGDVVAADEITITSTVGTPGPEILSIEPPSAKVGATVAVTGAHFELGLQVLFGATPSSQVTLDPQRPSERVVAVVPALPDGPVDVTVRNPDGRTSESASFTVQSQPLFVRGDVNLDGSLDIADVIRLVLHLYLGAPIGCRDAADGNNNEVLDVADVIYVLNFLFRGGRAPADPFPAPGVDTGNAGVLDCAQGV